MDEFQGGRVFTSANRSLEMEDEITLTSVGIDIGSSTSHFVVSRLTLERVETRYVISKRVVAFESGILLTPYTGDGAIDAARLGAFIAEQYRLAGITAAGIDTGALILTGVAVRRHNARAIGELFAAEAGKFVSVTAGDALEATLAAHGSGAVARSQRPGETILNIDVGGGTAKLALCRAGEVVAIAAIDVGARLVALDAAGAIVRIEEAARHFSDELGLGLRLHSPPPDGALARLAEHMAERLFQTIDGPPFAAAVTALQRLDPPRERWRPDVVIFSGGVAEFAYERAIGEFGDLGRPLAQALVARAKARSLAIEMPAEGIRATVIGASQYTVQVSGGTIFVRPPDTLPLHNLPVVAPVLPLGPDTIEPGAVATAISDALTRAELADGERAVALSVHWQGMASYRRLDAFCAGLIAGMAPVLARGFPLVLVCDGDVGGLIGIHCREERRLANAVVSIDGIDVKQFDFIDIGALLADSGAVPVVIKSLVFPRSAAIGRAGI